MTLEFPNGVKTFSQKLYPIKECTKSYFKTEYEKKYYNYYDRSKTKEPFKFLCVDDPKIYL